MAEQSIGLRDNHQAIAYYKEALKFAVDDTKTMAALARIYLQVSVYNITRHEYIVLRHVRCAPNY